LATAAADSEAPHVAAVAVAVVAVEVAASTIAVEVAALPIAVVAAEATSTTPATPDETATVTFLAKKVKKKAPVRPRHCSYLSSWFVLLRRSPELMLSVERADNVFRVGIERQ
jgi:hypothetical protein